MHQPTFASNENKNDTMKKVPLIVFLSILLVSCRSKEVVTDSTSFSPVDCVNPLVGTQSKFTLSTGNTYPAVALPWGHRKREIWDMDGPIVIQMIR